jgi:hypothetical protein
MSFVESPVIKISSSPRGREGEGEGEGEGNGKEKGKEKAKGEEFRFCFVTCCVSWFDGTDHDYYFLNLFFFSLSP